MFTYIGKAVMIPFAEAKALRETNPFDPRNVRNVFKGMENEDIQAELDKNRSEMVLCLSNEVRDMNLSSCIRSANSFNIDHVVMTERRNYDRRGAVGAQNYTHVRFMENRLEALAEYKAAGYHLVALEYDENYSMERIDQYGWFSKTIMVVGEEGRSLPSEVLDLADDIVYIPMMGTVRSLNLASAVSIALYDYSAEGA